MQIVARAARGQRLRTEYDEIVAVRLRQIREERGLTQGMLGAAIGVSMQQIQKYETGTNRISAGRLYAASRVLGAPLVEFYRDRGGAAHAR
ncbi:helix-turn-helix domain-containing protein [Rhodomicrobium lacus]|uniref:helix-turn-helix domain-containing protein n=1 Tax=Rhodomicrobium lacus TaxID=2498452 RepID=UPI000F8F739C|nr:helix-turn-helix transcriptional regulator [Rhodomicrobium lacus]